ncbi:uncharacterized protein IWZ02DRAFT_498947 [Phyllosticta citriasiana]|uniref:uncharacterized protein n=1 Tax=Phyllosticta citriasiana TaxID=595635 RepID=UPI0030FD837E
MLVVKALNGDASFLLVFAPSIAPDTPSVSQFPGAFTVLIDPRLTGPAKILASAFSVSHHQAEPCVSSLADLPEPDMVIVSQAKPDHCHKDTLTQLPPDTQSLIVAAPAAAAKIRKWKHFKPNNVHSLPVFSATDQSTTFRIQLPSFSPLGSPGQVTVTLISSKNDITGLHKAIGITYRAPTSILTHNRHTLINLPHRPAPPTSTKPGSTQNQSTNTSTSLSSSGPKPSPKPRAASIDVTIAAARLRDARSLAARSSKSISAPQAIHDNPTTIRSACSHSSIASALTSAGPDASPTRAREPTQSVLYAPHGVPYAALEPYVTSQLIGHAALPLTLLLHGFDRVDYPWFLGGNIATGAEGGGAEIARRLMARAWVAAHDGAKRSRGVSVGLLRTRRVGVEEVRRWVAVNSEGEVRKAPTRIRRLASGEEMMVK